MNTTVPQNKQITGRYANPTWAIHTYAGDSLFSLKPVSETPTFLRDDVDDILAGFVADPFMIQVDGLWYLFAEIINVETRLGEIGVATSENAIDWQYKGIVLREPFHLSYSFVFEWKGEYYMIPETLGANAIQLYKSRAFPFAWEPVSRMVEGEYADPTLFRKDDKWWLFAGANPYQSNTLNLFSADDLFDTFQEHPQSPLITNNNRKSRPAGRVVEEKGKLYRFCQDCYPVYGTAVRAMEITRLTEEEYQETESTKSPIFSPGKLGEWNGRGMHHIDAHQQSDGSWLAVVDGCYKEEENE